MVDKQQTLKHYFGHDGFRPGQEVLVDALLQGRDCLGVMPTGAGKSLCYQIPALMLDGVALVISPLISLMKDQVAALKSAGVPAAYLNSSLTPRQMDLATERARLGMYRVIYVAPERLDTASFCAFARQARISLIAVDEAHCVSQWGQDFRPDYRRIADFVDSLPVRPPVGAFTATATDRVREDIIRLLRLRRPALSFTGFDRPNLFFEVIQPESRYDALRMILRDKMGDSGIVYCATRKNVEEVCRKLREEGFSAGRYHAGLPDEERRSSQEDFQYDRVQIMVANNAFGMGIDKSNVRFVIHYNMPRSMEAYYQEAGRAGRDGEAAECVLLFSRQDIVTARWMIDNSEPNPDMTPAEQQAVRRQDIARLNAMIDYCGESGCLRRYIRTYFGENAPERCDGCSSCCGHRWGEAAEAKKRRARRVTIPGEAPSDGMTRLKLPKPGEGSLFEQLRACRMQLAKQYRVPPYIVCDDRTLSDMARRRPVTMDGLMTVHGMGAVKAGKYGEAFLRVIRDYDKTRTTLTLPQARQTEKPTAAKSFPSDAKKVFIPSTMSRSGEVPSDGFPSEVRRLHIPSTLPQRERVTAPVTAAEKTQLRRDYLAGVPIAQMAASLGRTEREVRSALQQMGLIV